MEVEMFTDTYVPRIHTLQEYALAPCVPCIYSQTPFCPWPYACCNMWINN